MDALEAEGDADRYTPSIACSDDDDADSDDDLFIDDEPIHAHPPLSRQYSTEPESDDDDTAWRDLAAEYERRAALQRVDDSTWDDLGAERDRRADLERDPSLNPAVAAGPLTLEEKMADISLVERLPSLLSPPMYTVRILPYWEYRLLRHLLSCPGVISSGTWGVGSGVVFVETRRVGDTGETGLLAAHLRNWKSAYRFYNRDLLVPRLCPLSERTRLLHPPGDSRFVHPYDLGNRWVRVSVPGLYHNDLAFVEEIDPSGHGQRLRVVPRIVLAFTDDPVRPPQRLLDPARFRAFHPGETLDLRNQILLWKQKDRQFGAHNYFHGLELLEIDDANFLHPISQRNVLPTEAELNLFRGCCSPQLNVPFTGFTCALQEGDRVVDAHTSSLFARAGYIYSIFPREVDGRSKTVRFARVLPETDGLVTLDLGSQEVASGWTVAISDLRLHILAIARPIRIGDRVRSVLGPAHRRLSLRVREVRHDTVEVYDTNRTSEETPAFNLQLRHVVHDFREGDVVRVLRGHHMGQRGLVVSLLPGGYVTLYPGKIEDEHFRLVPYSQLEPAALYSAPNPSKKWTEDDDLELGFYTTLYADTLVPPVSEPFKRPDITIRLASNYICFENWDSDDTQLARSRHKKPWEEMDSTTRALSQKMQDNERWLIGMFVRITGMHDLKGRCGEIKGYSWTRPRPEKGRPDYGTIELAVGLELRTGTDRLPFHSVVEREFATTSVHTRPLEATLSNPTRPGLDTSRNSLPCRYPRPWSDDEMYGEYNAPPDVGDADGTWLLHTRFVDKRIDVVVVDRLTMETIMKSSQRMTRQVNDKQLKFADAKGHLKILTQPLKKSETSSAMIGFISSEGKPYVFGSSARIGQYAEVVPGATRWPDRVLRVKFALERTAFDAVERPEMDYHLVSLCLAKNIPCEREAFQCGLGPFGQICTDGQAVGIFSLTRQSHQDLRRSSACNNVGVLPAVNKFPVPPDAIWLPVVASTLWKRRLAAIRAHSNQVPPRLASIGRRFEPGYFNVRAHQT
ncbi:hypothetical protein C8F01DRAFT_1094732 [Mycena amicta]|nr:hypothetical protein C8F01DRAFT_1094732 [Mycena amicta]